MDGSLRTDRLGQRAAEGPADGGVGVPQRCAARTSRRGRCTPSPVGIPDARALAAHEDGGLRRRPRVQARTGLSTPPGRTASARLRQASDVRCGQGRPRPASAPASAARYVTMTSAPARAIAVSVSSVAARRSRWPADAAAPSMATSPLTWYAARGRSKRSRARTSSVEVGERGLDHEDVGALGGIERELAQRCAAARRDPAGTCADHRRRAPSRRRRGRARRAPKRAWPHTRGWRSPRRPRCRARSGWRRPGRRSWPRARRCRRRRRRRPAPPRRAAAARHRWRRGPPRGRRSVRASCTRTGRHRPRGRAAGRHRGWPGAPPGPGRHGPAAAMPAASLRVETPKRRTPPTPRSGQPAGLATASAQPRPRRAGQSGDGPRLAVGSWTNSGATNCAGCSRVSRTSARMARLVRSRRGRVAPASPALRLASGACCLSPGRVSRTVMMDVPAHHAAPSPRGRAWSCQRLRDLGGQSRPCCRRAAPGTHPTSLPSASTRPATSVRRSRRAWRGRRWGPRSRRPGTSARPVRPRPPPAPPRHRGARRCQAWRRRSARTCTASAPWPGAGGTRLGSRASPMRSPRPSRASPATASTSASTSPSSSRRRRVSTLPLNGRMLQVGAQGEQEARATRGCRSRWSRARDGLDRGRRLAGAKDDAHRGRRRD